MLVFIFFSMPYRPMQGNNRTPPPRINAPEKVSMWMRSCSKPMTTDQKGDRSTSVASVAKAGCVRMVRLTASYTCLCGGKGLVGVCPDA